MTSKFKVSDKWEKKVVVVKDKRLKAEREKKTIFLSFQNAKSFAGKKSFPSMGVLYADCLK